MITIFYGLASLTITILVARWAFGIDSMLKAAKTQIGLLILIAKKNGATKEEVDDVLDKVYRKK